MIKKIILSMALTTLSIPAFANGNCHGQTVYDEEKDGVNFRTMTVTELKDFRDDLVQQKDKAEFDRVYTLTHNRIYKKSMDIQLNNKFDNLKLVNSDNEQNLKSIYGLQDRVNYNFGESFKKINNDTNEAYERNSSFLDYQISEIDNELKDRYKPFWN